MGPCETSRKELGNELFRFFRYFSLELTALLIKLGQEQKNCPDVLRD